MHRITISDNGIGIGLKNRYKLFKPFSRLHSKGDYDGTGLGLSTSKVIMEKHGGSMDLIESTPKGTTFSIDIPK